MAYNVFNHLNQDLADFDKEISVIQLKTGKTVRYLSGEESGYQFSQGDTLDTIDMMYNSKFKTGVTDSEGERKTFLNIVKFVAEVSRMQTDLDVKNFLFIPDLYKMIDMVSLLKRQFIVWTRKNQYGQVINDLNTDYSKYGTCVAKKVGDKIERVILHNLKNKKDAQTLLKAAKTGYVIEEHEMGLNELTDMPDWNTDKIELDIDTKVKVYERYSLVPLSEIKDFNEEPIEEGDENTYVLALQVLAPDLESLSSGNEATGDILFMEEIKDEDFPYEECHWDKQDGRWLGIGEVENQFENQIAKNLTANLRRRAQLWGGKKIFQTKGDAVVKNLVKEVRDGQVLEVGKNGEITQVATDTRHMADYQASSAELDENTSQKSFTFEVATGESLPSGTPFRLGVLLSNATQTRFGLKRENFGFFLERAFFNQIMPIFKKEMRNKEHVVKIMQDDEGAERFRNAMTTWHTNRLFMERLLSQKLERSLETMNFDFGEQWAAVEDELKKSPYLFMTVPAGVYDDVHYYMELEITGEGTDVQKEIETLVTVWQTMAQQQDPRAERVLEIIISKTGGNLQGVLGKTPKSGITEQLKSIEGEVAANPNLQNIANGQPAIQSPIGNGGGQTT